LKEVLVQVWELEDHSLTRVALTNFNLAAQRNTTGWISFVCNVFGTVAAQFFYTP